MDHNILNKKLNNLWKNINIITMLGNRIDKLRSFIIIFIIIALDAMFIYGIAHTIPELPKAPWFFYLILMLFVNTMAFLLIYSTDISEPFYVLINGLIEGSATLIIEFIEKFRIAPLLVSSLLISIFIVITASLIHSDGFTYGVITTVLTSLALIGALIFLFVPTGIDLINNNYQPFGRKLYNKNELSKTLITIMYSSSIFVMFYVIDILLGFFLSGSSKVFSFHPNISQSNNILNSFIYSFSLIYLGILIIGLGVFVYAFLNIFIILKYFYFYEQNYTSLKSNNNHQLIQGEIDWFIKRQVNYNPIKDNISSVEDFIDEFEIIKENNPRLFNNEIIRKILN